LPIRWKNPDVNNDGKVDIMDYLTVAGHFYEADGYDLNYDGIVDIDDVLFVGAHFGETRPPDEELPPLPDVYTLSFTLRKLSWFSQSAFETVVDSLLVAPAQVVCAALGYNYVGRDIFYRKTTVEVCVRFQKFASPSPPAAAVWAAIVIGGLIAVGVILIAVAWIYQARVEEQKTVSDAETKAKLAEELEKGLITKEQYEALMGKLLEEDGKQGDMWGTITQALPLLIGLAVVGAVVGLMPRRRD